MTKDNWYNFVGWAMPTLIFIAILKEFSFSVDNLSCKVIKSYTEFIDVKNFPNN